MTRAYSDYGTLMRQGYAGAQARSGNLRGAQRTLEGYDPERADAYGARADETEERRFTRDYAGAYNAGEFNRAGKIAAQRGNIAGVSAAREGAVQLDTQQRTAVLRGAQQNLAEIQAIEANEGQGYDEYLQRARAALQQNPNMDPSMARLIQSLPDQWNPRVTGAVRSYVTTMRDALLTPDQLADNELTARQRETQERQADIAERRAAATELTAQAAMLRAERAGSGGGGPNDSQTFSRANSLRDEYNQQTQSYRMVADTAARSEEYMRRIAQNPRAASGQADVGLVYALAKIYDPTSVVREGEFATMARQGGYGEQMRSWVLQAQGRGFSNEIRSQIMREIRNGLTAQRGQRDQTRTRYEGLAQRAGIDPSLVIDDYSAGAPAAPAAPGSMGGFAAPQRPPGVPPEAVWNARSGQWEAD